MPSELQPQKHRRQWGESTRLIIEAIQDGCTTLRQIAERTGISYRSVNATINSLELQDRVIADDYRVKRGLQEFRVLHEGRQPPRDRGFVEHPRRRQRADVNWHYLLHLGASDRIKNTQKNAASGREEAGQWMSDH